MTADSAMKKDGELAGRCVGVEWKVVTGDEFGVRWEYRNLASRSGIRSCAWFGVLEAGVVRRMIIRGAVVVKSGRKFIAFKISFPGQQNMSSTTTKTLERIPST